jgi:ferritin-like metal-binding protein YciE
MGYGIRRSVHSSRFGNLTERERWISTLLGVGLTLGALPRGGLLRRVALSAGGLMLLGRGIAGYCGAKAAVTGEASLGEGVREQWQRLRARVGAGAGGIDSMESLYAEELQELASSSAQLETLTEDLERSVEHPELTRKLRSYATLIHSRQEDLERILSSSGLHTHRHLDQAMRALAEEARKMAQIADSAVRDAALVDSLQRLLHYQIAAYGSVAAHAKARGEDESAARLAEYADRDKSLDAELTELAKELLDPRAATTPRAASPAGAYAH